jgi:hypothetical protein
VLSRRIAQSGLHASFPAPITSGVRATLIPLRYPARCGTCGAAIERGTQASWDREAKLATCVRCLPAAVVEQAIDRGQAGDSAAREWRNRHDRREKAIRDRYGRLSGIVLALSGDPHSTSAWAYGASGERALGRVLDPLREEGMAVLHYRCIPGSRANIDHLVVAPSGVYVVDAKNYKGRVERRDRVGFFSIDYRLYVGGRDKSMLLAGLGKQVEVVRSALAEEFSGVRISKVICFVDADWSLFARPLELDGVHVLWPRALGKLLRAEGPLESETISRLERRLALALPAA